MDLNYFQLDKIEDEKIAAVVIVSKYRGKWVFVRNKHKVTYENPGGQREIDEPILETASRELYEETGAVKFEIKPLEIYMAYTHNKYQYGLLCFADIQEIGNIPDSEIAEVIILENLPTDRSPPARPGSGRWRRGASPRRGQGAGRFPPYSNRNASLAGPPFRRTGVGRGSVARSR